MRWTLHLALVAMVAAILAPVSALHAAEPFDLKQYKGKVVILDFWASWCVPCRRSFPWLNEMQAKYASEGLVVIGVNLDNDAAEAQLFLDEFSPEFTIVYDTDKKLAHEYDVIAMPSSYVIARDGTIHERHLGYKVKLQADYEAVIVTALWEKENPDE
ncbi:MAG: TlpA family protein disulfide reductase [Gammaproteobacteria bacterium]|nr:TlpA family protein disulfide reductase [Gammaproteobacteria bacterium]